MPEKWHQVVLHFLEALNGRPFNAAITLPDIPTSFIRAVWILIAVEMGERVRPYTRDTVDKAAEKEEKFECGESVLLGFERPMMRRARSCSSGI